MNIMVVGGAGYIGSHAVRALLQNGHKVSVIDNLCTGHRESVPAEVPFYEVDIKDTEKLKEIFSNEKFDGVIHFAANSLVGESMTNPLKYYNNNVCGTESLLEALVATDTKNIVFSSTAATYGNPEVVPILETAPTNPTNPYGETKLAIEKMLKWTHEANGLNYVALRYFNVAGADILETAPTNPTNPYGETKLAIEKMLKWTHEANGLNYVALRYFNVAGADASGEIGEAHTTETHLIPIILQVLLGQRDAITVYGTDYPTEDGTCIRDYIHVSDLVDAHILALEYLLKGGESNVFNLGNNVGFSVKEIIEKTKEVTKQDIPTKYGERRAGDPAMLVASAEKAKTVLGWEPKYTNVGDIIATAWNWHESHPYGYSK